MRCYSVIDFYRNPYLQKLMCPNSKMEKSILSTRGETVNKLTYAYSFSSFMNLSLISVIRSDFENNFMFGCRH